MEHRPTYRNLGEIVRAGFVTFVVRVIRRLGYSDFGEPGAFAVETVHLTLKRLPRVFSGFRIAQISDLHMGGWLNAQRLQHVVDLVLAQKPDVLVITGDFLKGRSFTESTEQGLADLIRILSPVTSLIPTFAVLGNHDYWTNPRAIRSMLRECGITDLTNTAFAVNRQGKKIYLCGVDDIRYGNVRLNDVIAKLEADSAAILLVHEPDFADESAATGKFDLQISGHTHGGQIVIPFWGPPVLPPSGRKYPSGLYKVGDMFQYTNRGVGTDTISTRINCPPEITVFELDNAS